MAFASSLAALLSRFFADTFGKGGRERGSEDGGGALAGSVVSGRKALNSSSKSGAE